MRQADQQRCKSLTQVMDTHTRNPGLGLDLKPEAADYLDRLAGHIGEGQPRTAGCRAVCLWRTIVATSGEIGRR